MIRFVHVWFVTQSKWAGVQQQLWPQKMRKVSVFGFSSYHVVELREQKCNGIESGSSGVWYTPPLT